MILTRKISSAILNLPPKSYAILATSHPVTYGVLSPGHHNCAPAKNSGARNCDDQAPPLRSLFSHDNVLQNALKVAFLML